VKKQCTCTKITHFRDQLTCGPIHLEARHVVAVHDFNPTAAISENGPRGMSFEVLENRTELKFDWRNNSLPNNTVPGAIQIKLLSDVTCIVADSYKDKA